VSAERCSSRLGLEVKVDRIATLRHIGERVLSDLGDSAN
jgi:hypothetical protein